MRNIAYLLGVLLLIASVIAAGEMLTSGEPFDPVLPCALAALGAGIFGFGLFGAFAPEQANQCATGDSDETQEVDAE